jgi:transposase
MSKLIKLSQRYTKEDFREEIRKVKDNGLKLKMLVIEKILSTPTISAKEVQSTFFISPKRMYEWINQYNSDGLEGLKAKKKENRGSGKGRTKVDEEVYEKLKEEIEQTPNKKWTLKVKQSYIKEQFGIEVTQQAIAYRMKRC